MPPRPPSTARRDLLLVVVAGLVAFLAPPVIRSYGALQWTRYHTAQPPDGTGQHAREAARWASTALREGAPLPWAASAADLALDYGQRIENADNPAAALALYENLRATLAELSQSRWRSFGLAGLRERTESRAQAATAGKSRTPVPPAADTGATEP
jgi:hypothetical protein